MGDREGLMEMAANRNCKTCSSQITTTRIPSFSINRSDALPAAQL